MLLMNLVKVSYGSGELKLLLLAPDLNNNLPLEIFSELFVKEFFSKIARKNS